jgi:hypothetical protein
MSYHCAGSILKSEFPKNIWGGAPDFDISGRGGAVHLPPRHIYVLISGQDEVQNDATQSGKLDTWDS